MGSAYARGVPNIHTAGWETIWSRAITSLQVVVAPLMSHAATFRYAAAILLSFLFH